MNIIDDPVPILQKYLRIDTTDSQNDDKACHFWESLFSDYDVSNRIVKSGSFSNFETVAESGPVEKILFQNHLDVVPANSTDWKFDPFAGIIENNFLYGRGALDMKCIGVMQAYAFLKLYQKNHPQKYKLKFCSLVQEESSSEHGAMFYVEHLKKQGYKNLIVFGEGGFGVQIPDIFDGTMFIYDAEQKGLLWVSITVHSTGGHGSVSGKTKRSNPVIRSAKVAEKLSSHRFPIKIEDSVKVFISKLLNQSNNKIIRIVAHIPFLKTILLNTRIGAALLNSIITRVTRLPALFQTSLNVTNISTDKISSVIEPKSISQTLLRKIFRSTSKTKPNPLTSTGINVIPTYATMTCDIRFNSIYDKDSLIKQLKKIIPKDAELRIENYQAFSKSPCHIIQGAVEKVLHEIYDKKAFVSPILFIASSDSYFFRNYGHYAFGFSPIIVSSQDLQRIHGDDERINIDAFRNGCEDYYRVIKKALEELK